MLVQESRKYNDTAGATNIKNAMHAAQLYTVAADVGDYDALSSALEHAFQEVGVPEVVIHSAGYAFSGAFTSIDAEKTAHIFRVNLFGTWNMMQCIMRKVQSGAIIVNIASFAALLTCFGYSAYAASKCGVLGLSETLRNEFQHRGITIKVACPTDTDTPQLKYEAAHKPAETAAITGTTKPYSAEYVAHYILKHCRRGPFLIIPGFFPKCIWALKRLFPRLVYRIIDAMLLRYYRT